MMDSALLSNTGSCNPALKELSDATQAACSAFKAATSSFFPLDANSAAVRCFILLFEKTTNEVLATMKKLNDYPPRMKFTCDFFVGVNQMIHQLHQIAKIIAPLSKLLRDECQKPRLHYCNPNDTAEMTEASKRLQMMWHTTLKQAMMLYSETLHIKDDINLLFYEWDSILTKVREHLECVKNGARRYPQKPAIEDSEIFLFCKRCNFQLTIFLPEAYAHFGYWDCFSLALWIELDQKSMTALEQDVFGEDEQLRNFFHEALLQLPVMTGKNKVCGKEILALGMLILKTMEARKRKVTMDMIQQMLLEAVGKIEENPEFLNRESLKEFFQKHPLPQKDTDKDKTDKTEQQIVNSDTWKKLLASFKAGDMQALTINTD